MTRRPNQSPEPTAVGAASSAVAVRAASRRWLSFWSSGIYDSLKQMKARDIFGIVVRTFGLFAVLFSVGNLVCCLLAASPLYLICGVPALIVGIALLRFGRQIVRFGYPKNKDDADT